MTLIAVKREVAALIKQVFRGANVNAGDNLRRRNWRQVTVPTIKSTCKSGNDRVQTSGHTRVSVQSPLVVLVKVRKGGDFFYGKSSNENYTESV